MTNFSNNLQKFRHDKKMTQKEMAKKTGLEQSHISHFECDRRSPNLKNLIILSKALNCTIDDLVN